MEEEQTYPDGDSTAQPVPEVVYVEDDAPAEEFAMPVGPPTPHTPSGPVVADTEMLAVPKQQRMPQDFRRHRDAQLAAAAACAPDTNTVPAPTAPIHIPCRRPTASHDRRDRHRDRRHSRRAERQYAPVLETVEEAEMDDLVAAIESEST